MSREIRVTIPSLADLSRAYGETRVWLRYVKSLACLYWNNFHDDVAAGWDSIHNDTKERIMAVAFLLVVFCLIAVTVGMAIDGPSMRRAESDNGTWTNWVYTPVRENMPIRTETLSEVVATDCQPQTVERVGTLRMPIAWPERWSWPVTASDLEPEKDADLMSPRTSYHESIYQSSDDVKPRSTEARSRHRYYYRHYRRH